MSVLRQCWHCLCCPDYEKRRAHKLGSELLLLEEMAHSRSEFALMILLLPTSSTHRPGASLSTSVLQARYPSNGSRQNTCSFIKRISTAMHTVSRNCGASEELHQQASCPVSILASKGNPPQTLAPQPPLVECNLIAVWNAVNRSYYRYRELSSAHSIEIADTLIIGTTTPLQSATCTYIPHCEDPGRCPADFKKKLPLCRYE